jgi:hypothetical protein
MKRVPQPIKRRKRARPPEEEEDGWEAVPMSAYTKAFFDICIAMKQVEAARAALNEAQANLDTKVSTATKQAASDFRQFRAAGGVTSNQWRDWDPSKPKLAVRQKRGLRLVVNRAPILRVRLVEEDDGPKAA